MTSSPVRVLRGESLSPPPVWLMRQAGRYLPEYRALRARAGSFLDLCLTPAHAIEATLQPMRRFDPDAAILFSDLPLPAWGMGQGLTYREGVGPVLEPVRSLADLQRLSLDILPGRLAPVYETVASLREILPPEKALIGFAGAPWTLATYMAGGQGGAEGRAFTKRWAYGDPAGFGQLISLICDAVTTFLSAQFAAGIDAAQIFDTWAGELSGEAFRQWCIGPVARIVRNVRARFPHALFIGFPGRSGFGYRSFGAGTGVNALSLDASVPLDEALALPPGMVLQGNLDPDLVVVGGEPMREEIRRIIGAFHGRPHIFNLGHGLTPGTPPGHVADLFATIRASGREGG